MWFFKNGTSWPDFGPNMGGGYWKIDTLTFSPRKTFYKTLRAKISWDDRCKLAQELSQNKFFPGLKKKKTC